MTPLPPPPDWYPDPQQPAVGQRWWDGQGWTAHVRGAVHVTARTTWYAPAERSVSTAGAVVIAAVLFLGMVVLAVAGIAQQEQRQELVDQRTCGAISPACGPTGQP